MVTECIGLKNSVIFYVSLNWKQTFSFFWEREIELQQV